MPCGPVTPGVKTRSEGAIVDPFSFSDGSAMMRSWTNMTIFFAAPMRAAMVVADEVVRDTMGEPD